MNRLWHSRSCLKHSKGSAFGFATSAMSRRGSWTTVGAQPAGKHSCHVRSLRDKATAQRPNARKNGGDYGNKPSARVILTTPETSAARSRVGCCAIRLIGETTASGILNTQAATESNSKNAITARRRRQLQRWMYRLPCILCKTAFMSSDLTLPAPLQRWLCGAYISR